MALAVQNSMMTFQPSPGHWRCFVVDGKGWDEFQLTLAEPRSQLPVPPVGLPSLSGLPCLPRSSLVMPPVPFLVLSHGLVFVTEGFSVVLTVLVFFQEGLNGGVLVGMFHVEMSVYEPEVNCSKGVKCVDVVSVCYVAMLVPPQVSLDVGPAPCVAGPAGFGYALALVEWHTLRFQSFSVCAAMMAADGVNLVTMDCEYMMLELASRLAVFDGKSSVPMDAAHKKLELAFLLAGFEPEISVPMDYDKAAAAIAGKCVFAPRFWSQKGPCFFQRMMKRQEKKGKRRKEKKRIRKGMRRRKKKEGSQPLLLFLRR